MRRRGRGHYIASQKAEALLGVTLLLAGAVLLKDAYEGRGRPQPAFMRPFTFL